VTDSDRRFDSVLDERQVMSDETTPPTPGDRHAVVRDMLSDYLEDALPPPLREAVQQHLDGCPSCLAFLRTLRSTVELVGQLPTHRLPDRARRRIIDRLATTADSSSGGA
jgi:anti-sigma factor RsiW